MKYKIGDTVRIVSCTGHHSKKTCVGLESTITHIDGEYIIIADVGVGHASFYTEDELKLIKPKVKKPSKPKVCKHKWEIHSTNKYSHQEFGIKHFEQVLVAVCKLCLEKKYI